MVIIIIIQFYERSLCQCFEHTKNYDHGDASLCITGLLALDAEPPSLICPKSMGEF